MPVVDLGVDFDDVKDQDIIEPMPVGTYEFQVESVEETTASESGRPMLKWVHNIINHPEYNGRKLFNNTVLPWVDPKTGERDINVFGLVAQCKTLGVPWQGRALNTEEYVGLVGKCEVKQVPKRVKELDPESGKVKWVDDTTVPAMNEIKKFIY